MSLDANLDKSFDVRSINQTVLWEKWNADSEGSAMLVLQKTLNECSRPMSGFEFSGYQT